MTRPIHTLYNISWLDIVLFIYKYRIIILFWAAKIEIRLH
ncbi:hypothetical protein F-S17_0070 [Faustovirus]|nr:hypothetical protein F-LCD7_0085 [Faustovirus]QJX72336.1 hypothetical protein F-S17_0070 [Faustovirus]QJX72846.1 hypothetical protein F-VV57_0084 [Faustovirus]QJX73352.1 hypothetical protein F-VV63_0086 [Faustovirus]QJX73860.1 hypothetical protein F-E9_87 [Faustovirus]